MYRDEEKRINQLYGSKKGLKYKIKLNDKILDSSKESKSPLTKGRLTLGKTIEPNPLMQVNIAKLNEKKEKDDIFGTMSKLPLGPGDYSVNVDPIKNHSPSLKFSHKASEYVAEELSLQKQFKQIRQFDGSSSTIKPMQKPIKCEPLEARQIVEGFADQNGGSKAHFVFNSKSERFKQNSYLNYANNPGP